MSKTVKRITLALTKEDLRILETLEKNFGEAASTVIKRALMTLYIRTVPITTIPLGGESK